MERIITEKGTVTACNGENDLTVILDGGEEVLVPHDEMHKDSTDYNFGRHVGKEIELVDTYKRTSDGRRIFSHRIVEENDLEWITHNFRTGKRNTYWAQYRGITKEGTLAFYQIGNTTVNGAISLKDFALSHTKSYKNCIMPSAIQVVITEIKDGKISLSSIPGFIGFEKTVEMLKLHPGSSPLGKATNKIGGRLSTMIMITPNVSTLIDGDFEDADVKVLITSINHEKRKIKSRLDSVISMPGNNCVDYNRYIEKDPLPEYLDLDDYKAENGYFKKRGGESTKETNIVTPFVASAVKETDEREKTGILPFLKSVRSFLAS